MNLVLKWKSIFEETHIFLGSFFQKKEGYRLRNIVDFFQKNFVLEAAWFGPICSENTIIELNFEIEVVFFEATNIFVGLDFFKKRKA